MPFLWARLVATGLVLAAAFGRHPYDFYTIMRWVVCGVCAYGAYTEFERKRQPWGWAFAIVAVAFNPLAPVHLTRDTWAPIDVAAGAIVVASLFKNVSTKEASRD